MSFSGCILWMNLPIMTEHTHQKIISHWSGKILCWKKISLFNWEAWRRRMFSFVQIQQSQKAEAETQTERGGECKAANIKNWFRAAARFSRWWVNVNGNEQSGSQQNAFRMQRRRGGSWDGKNAPEKSCGVAIRSSLRSHLFQRNFNRPVGLAKPADRFDWAVRFSKMKETTIATTQSGRHPTTSKETNSQ